MYWLPIEEKLSILIGGTTDDNSWPSYLRHVGNLFISNKLKPKFVIRMSNMSSSSSSDED